MRPFDDRTFVSGAFLSSPEGDDRKQCACCGQRIVKGFIIAQGPIGEDCAKLIGDFKVANNIYKTTVEQFVTSRRANYAREIKPIALRFLRYLAFKGTNSTGAKNES